MKIRLLSAIAIATLATSVSAKYIPVESDQDLAKEQYFLHPMINPTQVIYIDVKKDLKLLQKGKYILSSEELGMEGMMMAQQKNQANPPIIDFNDDPVERVFTSIPDRLTKAEKQKEKDLFEKSITFGYEFNGEYAVSDATAEKAGKEYQALAENKQKNYVTSPKDSIKKMGGKGLTEKSKEVVHKLRSDGHTVLIDIDKREYSISYDFSHSRFAGKDKLAKTNQMIAGRIASVLSRYMDVSDDFIFEVSKPHKNKYSTQPGYNLMLIGVDRGGKTVDYQSFLSNDPKYKKLVLEDRKNGIEYVWGKSKSMTYKNQMMMVEYEKGRAKPQMPTQYLAYKVNSKSISKSLGKERAAPRVGFKN